MGRFLNDVAVCLNFSVAVSHMYNITPIPLIEWRLLTKTVRVSLGS